MGEGYSLKAVTMGLAGDSGVPAGRSLIAFAEAVVGVGEDDLAKAREVLSIELGHAGVVDAAAVVASFDAVVRLADGCGIPLEAFKLEEAASIASELGWDPREEGAPGWEGCK